MSRTCYILTNFLQTPSPVNEKLLIDRSNEIYRLRERRSSAFLSLDDDSVFFFEHSLVTNNWRRKLVSKQKNRQEIIIEYEQVLCNGKEYPEKEKIAARKRPFFCLQSLEDSKFK